MLELVGKATVLGPLFTALAEAAPEYYFIFGPKSVQALVVKDTRAADVTIPAAAFESYKCDGPSNECHRYLYADKDTEASNSRRTYHVFLNVERLANLIAPWADRVGLIKAGPTADLMDRVCIQYDSDEAALGVCALTQFTHPPTSGKAPKREVFTKTDATVFGLVSFGADETSTKKKPAPKGKAAKNSKADAGDAAPAASTVGPKVLLRFPVTGGAEQPRIDEDVLAAQSRDGTVALSSQLLTTMIARLENYLSRREGRLVITCMDNTVNFAAKCMASGYGTREVDLCLKDGVAGMDVERDDLDTITGVRPHGVAYTMLAQRMNEDTAEVERRQKWEAEGRARGGAAGGRGAGRGRGRGKRGREADDAAAPSAYVAPKPVRCSNFATEVILQTMCGDLSIMGHFGHLSPDVALAVQCGQMIVATVQPTGLAGAKVRFIVTMMGVA